MISHLRLLFIIALLSLQTPTAFAAVTTTCERLFRISNKVTVTFIPQPKRIENPILSDPELDRIYDGIHSAQQAGAAILKYMKSLPLEMSSETKARIWMELTRGILRRKSLVFFSDTYRLPGHRYLFRGVKGESLFIDSDGSLYRLMTPWLEDQDTWTISYRKMVRLN